MGPLASLFCTPNISPPLEEQYEDKEGWFPMCLVFALKALTLHGLLLREWGEGKKAISIMTTFAV